MVPSQILVIIYAQSVTHTFITAPASVPLASKEKVMVVDEDETLPISTFEFGTTST